MARINNLTNFLNDVATAIKTKLGDSTNIPAAEFDNKIMEIETAGNYQNKSTTITTNGNYNLLPDTGFDAMDQVDIEVNVPSPDLSDATAQAQDIIRDKTAYTSNGKITGIMPNNGALNYTPSTSQQTIPEGYTSGGTIEAVTSSIDNNIQADNIKKDVTILGVTGTLEQNVNLDMTNVATSSPATGNDLNLLKKCISSFGSDVIFDLQGSINAGFLFGGCANLTKIPTLKNTNSLLYCHYMFAYMYNVDEMPYFDTSLVMNFYCFAINSLFVTVPVLNLQSATNLRNMFSGCSNLSEDSLNNILSMCTSATNYSNTKTLKYIGISSTQAQTCTTLSNYQDFIDAGWTTGY